MARFRHMERGSAVEPIFSDDGLAVEHVRHVDHRPLLPQRERWTQWSFRIMRAGMCYVANGNRTLTHAPTTLLWHSPLREPVGLRALPGSSSDQLVIRLSTARWNQWLTANGAFCQQHAAQLAQPPVFELGSAPPQLLLVIRDLLALHDALRPSPQAIEQQVALLLHLIGGLVFDRQASNPAPERRQRVEAAQALLASNLQQPPSLEQLARQFNVSPRQLQRDFLACAGLTPRRYLNIMRLSEANTLLADTSLPVAAIAARLGYNSQAHFSAAFRAVYHCSPRELRAALHCYVDLNEPVAPISSRMRRRVNHEPNKH